MYTARVQSVYIMTCTHRVHNVHRVYIMQCVIEIIEIRVMSNESKSCPKRNMQDILHS